MNPTTTPEFIVGCVRVGDKFSVRYANNLYAMLRRCIKRNFIFLLITDNDKELVPGIIPQTPKNDVWGWWHFMEFYSSDLGNPDWATLPRIYFGLDTVIRADITKFLTSRKGQYTLSLDFNELIGNPNKLYAGTWADCAAVIPKGGVPWLYDLFLEEHAKTNLGTAHYPMHVWVTHKLIEHNIQPAIWQTIYPDVLCSYKWPSPKIDEPPEPMVFFHGLPMIEDVLHQAKWINKYWHCEDI